MDSSVELYRDGTLVGTFKDHGSAMAYIHRMHSYSFSHAIAHEGYSMRLTTEAEPARISDSEEA